MPQDYLSVFFNEYFLTDLRFETNLFVYWETQYETKYSNVFEKQNIFQFCLTTLPMCPFW